MEQACAALCETGTPVLEIALQYGYASQEGFSRAFKAHYGMPPARYRRKHRQNDIYFKEGKGMIPKEVLKKIDGQMKIIINDVQAHKDGVIRIAEAAEKAAESAENKGKTVLIIVYELKSLAERTNSFIEDIKTIAASGQTVYEITEKIFYVAKALDDIAFQMNLLTCFSGIEVARIGEPIEEFNEFFRGIGELTWRIVNEKEGLVNLLMDITALLRAEIKKEAVGLLNTALEELHKAVEEGVSIGNIEDSLPLKTIAFLAREAKERAAAGVKSVADKLADFTAEMEKREPGSIYKPDTVTVGEGIKIIEDMAFYMNVNAFNAAIETARSGGDKDLLKYAERIRDYAGQLQQAAKNCKYYFDESIRLAGLAFFSDQQTGRSEKQKALEDIIFQGSLLGIQFVLEAERARPIYDGFVPIAKRVEEAVSTYEAAKITFAEYGEAVKAMLDDMNAEIQKCGKYAPPFAYIAKEYGYYLQRINTVINNP
jgi:hypothetical protein